MTIISTTVESLRKNVVDLIVNKSPKCSSWVQSQNNRMISVHFKGKPFNITVIQVYDPTRNTEEAEVEQFHEDLEDLLELIPKKMSSSLCVCVCVCVAYLRLTLCNPIDCNQPSPHVHGILQPRVLE